MAKKTTRKKVVTPKAKVTKIAIDEKQELAKEAAVIPQEGFAPIDEEPQSVAGEPFLGEPMHKPNIEAIVAGLGIPAELLALPKGDQTEDLEIKPGIPNIPDVITSEDLLVQVPEPTVQVPEPIPALPPDPEPEEQPEDIQALFKKHIVKEAVPEVEEPRPTRGHQQKIFGDKPVKKGGGTVRTRFTDIPIKGKRYGNVDEPETLPKGPGTIRTTGRTTTCK